MEQDAKNFKLTKSHISMARTMDMSPFYSFAKPLPEMDVSCYGKKALCWSNASHHAANVLNIPLPEIKKAYAEKDMEKILDLLTDMPVVLKIIRTHATFEPGIYPLSRLDPAWDERKMAKNYAKLRGALMELSDRHLSDSPTEKQPSEFDELDRRCRTITAKDPFHAAANICRLMKLDQDVIDLFEKHGKA